VRTLFLVLLFANIALFAWWRYGPADADPAPLQREIEPEKLKVIRPADLPPPSVARSDKSAPLPAGATACLEWGSFTLADTARAELALEPLALGPRLTQRRIQEFAAWWVFIPSQGRPAAFKKAAELKDLGIEDYFIVQEEGEHRWALSLGLFRSEKAAQARLAALRDQGVRTARVIARETVVPRVWLQVKGADAVLQERLKGIARQIEGSELRACGG
jgi:hypothetical protein